MKKNSSGIVNDIIESRFGKRLIAGMLIVVMVIAILLAAPVSTTKVIHMYVDGKEIAFNSSMGYPIISNERTLVPIKIISDYMGYTTDWSKDTWSQGVKKVWVKGDGVSIELDVDKIHAKVNGVVVPVDPRKDSSGTVVATDTKVIVYKNRTYVPVTFIAQNMGAKVTFKQANGEFYVYINRDGNTDIPEIPTTGMGTLEGHAVLTDKGSVANMEKISDYFGDYADAGFDRSYMQMFNPIAAKTGNSGVFEFFYIVDKPGENIRINIKHWYIEGADYSDSEFQDEYKLLNPAIKSVLNFYLPNGGEKLYKILDDGFNYRWDKASNYLNKDLRPQIGDDGYKVDIFDGSGTLVITIYR